MTDIRTLPLAPGAEFDLIRRFVPRPDPRRNDVLVGVGDDCAVVTGHGHGIALSTDMSMEGVHFRRDWLSMREIGFRAAAAALSDLAAVAARPIGVLVSLALPPEDAGDPAVELMKGAREAAESVGAAVLGGDVTRSPGPLAVDVTVVGDSAKPVLRSGAQHGDDVWVTGELGAAAAAVACLLRGEEPPAAARERFARPAPRVREARWLAERGLLHSLVDLSDGLAGDAAHLSAASGAAILLSAEMIPVHPAVRQVAGDDQAALRMAVGGGEDFELCFTAPVGAVLGHTIDFERELGVPLTCIGRVGGGDGVWWVDAQGSRSALGIDAYQHFAGGA